MDTVRARKAMVDSQVRPNDVPDMTLQQAMLELPRETFVPTNLRGQAYVELDVPLFEGRCLLKARDFSKLVHGAQIKTSDLVLDVGCGFGYSTAVMSKLASVVVGLESDSTNVERASGHLSDLGIDNAAVVEGALADGVPSQGPYDAIVVAGAVEGGLDALLSQLKPDGGRLVTILWKNGLGNAVRISRSGDSFSTVGLFEASPMLALPEFEQAKAFVF